MSAIYYTKEHEWARVEGNTAVIGISEHAAHELGDVTFVELPSVGKVVKQGDVIAAIESVKAASDIYAPVSGKVVKVNSDLDANPEKVNESPEEIAWMLELEMADTSETSSLMNSEQYEAFLKTV